VTEAAPGLVLLACELVVQAVQRAALGGPGQLGLGGGVAGVVGGAGGERVPEARAGGKGYLAAAVGDGTHVGVMLLFSPAVGFGRSSSSGMVLEQLPAFGAA
jgi:hypothetical protein